jgi:hypothetical protein
MPRPSPGFTTLLAVQLLSSLCQHIERVAMEATTAKLLGQSCQTSTVRRQEIKLGYRTHLDCSILYTLDLHKVNHPHSTTAAMALKEYGEIINILYILAPVLTLFLVFNRTLGRLTVGD